MEKGLRMIRYMNDKHGHLEKMDENFTVNQALSPRIKAKHAADLNIIRI